MKTVQIGDIPIHLVSSKRAKRISLRARSGVITLTKPVWTPTNIAVSFALSKQNWINDHYIERQVIKDGHVIGSVSLRISEGQRKAHKWQYPQLSLIMKSPYSQEDIHKQLDKAMRDRTRRIAEEMISIIAPRMSVQVNKLRVAKTTSRWGSCSSRGTVSFSLFAAQLPLHLFKYLVIHELAHLRHPNHSTSFWIYVARFDKGYARHRKELKSYSLSY